MDAIHYDKIADKLVQFHKKLPIVNEVLDERAQEKIRNLKTLIMTMLYEIDSLSDWDDKGWIK